MKKSIKQQDLPTVEEPIKHQYQRDYEEFVTKCNDGEINAAEVGMLIVKMALYFSEYNNRHTEAEIIFSKKASEIEFSVEEDTGKSITSTKAKIKSEATSEAADKERVFTHLKNIEQYINSLKALQKGLLNEYSHMGAT